MIIKILINILIYAIVLYVVIYLIYKVNISIYLYLMTLFAVSVMRIMQLKFNINDDEPWDIRSLLRKK